MSVPPMISPWHPHGQLQRCTYVQDVSIVPRSTMLRGVPKRVVTTVVSRTIVGHAYPRWPVYTRAGSTIRVIVPAARGGWKWRP